MRDQSPENEPLLPNVNPHLKKDRVQHSIGSKISNVIGSFITKEYKREFLNIFFIAMPTIVTSLSRFGTLSISIIMCGHLDNLQLDAATLANSLINVFGIGINLGFSTACDTLFSQSFGTGNKKKAGFFLQQSLIAALPILMVGTCIFLNIESLLVMIGQDPRISMMAAEYITLFLPGVYFDCGFIVLARFMQNQEIVYPPMVCGLIANIVNAGGQYLSIYVYNQDYHASAVWQAISFAVALGCEIVYVYWSKIHQDIWDGWKPRALFENLGPIFLLGIAGILMVIFEEWVFEIGTFAAGTMGTVQLGAQGVVYQLEALGYMLPLGMGVAVNIRVGNQLGARNPMGAKFSYLVGLSIILMSATIMAFLFISFSNVLPYLFTSDPEVIEMSASVIKILGVFQFADGITAVSGGALRGCGRQILGSVMVFIGFYVLSLPIGLTLGLATSLQVLGIWIGMLIGMGTEGLAFVFLILRTDWEKESVTAIHRVEGVLEASGERSSEYPSSDSRSRKYSNRSSFSCDERQRKHSSISGSRFPGYAAPTVILIDKDQNFREPMNIHFAGDVIEQLSFMQGTILRATHGGDESVHGQRRRCKSYNCDIPLAVAQTSEGQRRSLSYSVFPSEWKKTAEETQLLVPEEKVQSSSSIRRDNLPRLILKRSLLFMSVLLLLCISIWLHVTYERTWMNLCITNSSTALSLNITLPDFCDTSIM